MVDKIVAVVLDVALALDLGIERNHDKATPSAIIGRADLREMVGVKYQAVAGRKAEGVFVLFLRKDVIGGTELLDGGVVQPSAFLHLGGNEQTLTLDLRHLRLHIPAASEGQGVSGNIAAVQTKDSGDGVPEGGLAVAATAVCDDEGFNLHLANCRQAADHLHIVDEFPIPAENGVQAVEPDLLATVSGRNGGTQG